MKQTSELYRTFNKETQEWEDDCVCRDCAITIRDDINSKFEVFYDIYATQCYTNDRDVDGNIEGIDEKFDEDYEVETCPICEEYIPRGSAIYNFIGKIDDVKDC
ncbi:hypothetical protein [Capnocytophaga canimorsus]|uniref:hypothetical protein n=1 Tax=Capnocytophaga canimorsus TaxID=28188 RepID=UPI0037D562AB